MKHLVLLSAAAILFAGCSAADDDGTVPADAPQAAPTQTEIAADAVGDTPTDSGVTFSGTAIPDELNADGQVVITVDRTVAEDAACLLMIDVANGTDRTVTAGLFAFDVTGDDMSAGANMFPQTAEPGEIATAQIVLPGADCAQAASIEGGQLNCKYAETGESCNAVTDLRDGALDFVEPETGSVD